MVPGPHLISDLPKFAPKFARSRRAKHVFPRAFGYHDDTSSSSIKVFCTMDSSRLYHSPRLQAYLVSNDIKERLWHPNLDCGRPLNSASFDRNNDPGRGSYTGPLYLRSDPGRFDAHRLLHPDHQFRWSDRPDRVLPCEFCADPGQLHGKRGRLRRRVFQPLE
jgi:hypothetical protein